MKHLLSALCVFAVVLLSGTAAYASKAKVVVTPIDGDTGGEVHKALSAALSGDDFSVATLKETTKAIKSMGGLDDDASDKDFGKLADAASADVIVAGKLDGTGDGKTLHIKVYVKGKKSKKFSVQFGNPKSEKFRKTMHNTLVEKIGAINKSGDDEDADTTPKKKKKKGDTDADTDTDADAVKPMKKVKKKTTDDTDDTDADASPKKKKKVVADDTEDTTDDADAAPKKHKKKKHKADPDDPDSIDETDDGESPIKGPPHAANRDAIRADFGIGVANRTLTFNSRAFTDNLGPPKPYANSPVPSGHISGELFPLAFTDAKSRGAGLGIWGDFDKTISLTLQSLQPDTGMTIRAKATQQRWSIGGGYRFLFSASDVSPSVTIGLNYGQQEFVVDRSGLGTAVIDLPDTNYKMFEPLLNFRIPFASSVALVASGRGLLITDAGSIVKADQYGQAKVFGFQGEAGLDITFAQKFALRAMGFFNQVGYTFTKGAGEKANDRDGDPMTKDVFGALDRSMGATITLGVLYEHRRPRSGTLEA